MFAKYEWFSLEHGDLPRYINLLHVVSHPLPTLFTLQSMLGFSPDCLFGVSWEGQLTLASRLKQTTQSLMELVTTSQPHFILCLSPKPNGINKVSRQSYLIS